MTARKYSSRAQQTTLSAPITSTATTMSVISGSALMGGKTVTGTTTYTVVLDPDTALEEIVDVTVYASGNSLTISRGIDGPTPGTGVAHSAGAVVRHMAIGRDYQEANDHIEAVTGHGVTTGAIVGTTNTQTLTNKTLTSPVITTPTITSLTLGDGNIVFEGATADAFETTLTVVDPTADRTVSIPDATTTLVGTDTTQTLTNKTLTSPTITGTGAIAGTFTGNVTGNVTGSSGSTTGNAATATALATARTFQLTGDVEASGVTFDGTGNVSLTTIIGTGAIVNADVNSSAQIAYGKLALTNSIVNADINASAAIDKTKISGTAITAGDTGTVTSTMIANGTIVDADINASAAIALSKLATDPLARANHTGTQAASTISDFDTQVRTSKLNQMATPAADVSMATYKITNLGTPTSNTDASTKAYVDTSIANLIDGAPATLDTLNEIAAALADNASFSDTVVLKSGSTMTGNLAMGTNKVTGLGTPTSSTDAATKAYADTMLPLAGGTMSGAIAMGTNKITGVGDPTNAQDVVTKYYLDNVVLAPSNLTGPITSVGAATSIASQTGTGSTFVMNTSPTIVTPTIASITGITGLNSVAGSNTNVFANHNTGSVFIGSNQTTGAISLGATQGTVNLLNTTGTANKTINIGGNSTSGTTTVNIGSTAGATSNVTISGTAIPSSKTLVATDSTQYVVPSQTGNSGKYLTTDGTTSSWAAVNVSAIDDNYILALMGAI